MNTDTVVVDKKAETVNKMSYCQHSDNTRAVPFVSESEVISLAAAEKRRQTLAKQSRTPPILTVDVVSKANDTIGEVA
jgi:hypothetical protein